LGKALNGTVSTFGDSRQAVTGAWQLDSKTEKVPSLSPGRGTLANI